MTIIYRRFDHAFVCACETTVPHDTWWYVIANIRFEPAHVCRYIIARSVHVKLVLKLVSSVPSVRVAFSFANRILSARLYTFGVCVYLTACSLAAKKPPTGLVWKHHPASRCLRHCAGTSQPPEPHISTARQIHARLMMFGPTVCRCHCRCCWLPPFRCAPTFTSIPQLHWIILSFYLRSFCEPYFEPQCIV